MKIFRIFIILSILGVFVYPTTLCAAVVGPYSGHVLDAETGQPIEGATVYMYWTKLIAKPVQGDMDPLRLLIAFQEGVNTRQLFLMRSEDVDARLNYTDNKGKYHVSTVSVNTGPFGRIEKIHLIIYQPGYQAYIKEQMLNDPSSQPDQDFHETSNIIKLQRIPAKFDHERHYETIRDALREIGESDCDQTCRAPGDTKTFPRFPGASAMRADRPLRRYSPKRYSGAL